MQDRKQIENIWRNRLRDAKLQLDFARNYLKEVQRDFSLSDTSPDGQYAYQRALRVEELALAEYVRVLRLYTGLVLESKIPDENEWRNAAGAE